MERTSLQLQYAHLKAFQERYNPNLDGANHPGKPYGHAVVIGSSVAGLMAAKVLSGYFQRVTLIERDLQPVPNEFRRGAPQARHTHSLQPLGQMILEKQFPGLAEEILAKGAEDIDAQGEVAFFEKGKWQTPRSSSRNRLFASSRTLLEATIYQRVRVLPEVKILHECQVVRLTTDQSGQRVTGVRLHSRKAGLDETSLRADLVVDASGRNSQAGQWLKSLGYSPAGESVVNAHTGYASRIYRRPEGFDPGWKSLYIRPEAPNHTRGGIVLPLEGDRWHVTLIGMAGDYPPTDEGGFLNFARGMATPELYQAIKGAQPLSKPVGYRRTENRLCHYEKLPRYLEGFLVLGDAAHTLNPVYALGMTAAALGSRALEESLKAQGRQKNPNDLAGLAGVFQNEQAKAIASLWKLAVSQDQKWPGTEICELPASPLGVPSPARQKPLPAAASA